MRQFGLALLFAGCLLANGTYAQQSPEQLLRSIVPAGAKCERNQGGLQCYFNSLDKMFLEYDAKGVVMNVTYQSAQSASMEVVVRGAGTDFSALSPHMAAVNRFFDGFSIPQKDRASCISGVPGPDVDVISGNVKMRCRFSTEKYPWNRNPPLGSRAQIDISISPNNTF